MLPNEKHEFSAVWQAAQKGARAAWQAAPQDGGWASGLHIKLGCGKARAGGLPFSAARPALFRNPTDRFFVQPAVLSCVQQPVSRPKIHLFHFETQPSSHHSYVSRQSSSRQPVVNKTDPAKYR